jgi:hypothetical protein
VGVAGSNPATPTIQIKHLSGMSRAGVLARAQIRAQKFPHRARFGPLVGARIGGRGLMIRAMVAVAAVDHLTRHADEVGDHVNRRAEPQDYGPAAAWPTNKAGECINCLNGIGTSVIRRPGGDAIRTKIIFRPKRSPIGKPITLGHFSTASVKLRHRRMSPSRRLCPREWICQWPC